MASATYMNSVSNYSMNCGWAARSASTTKEFSRPKLNFRMGVPPESISSIKTDEIYHQAVSAPIQLRASGQTESKDPAVLSPLVLNGAEVIKELSGHVRESYALHHKVYGTQNPQEMAALGLTTGFSLISGGLSAKAGIKEVEKANRINDAAGKALGGIKTAKGVASAAGGAVYIPARALSIAALLSPAPILAPLAGVLGSIGSAFFQLAMVVGVVGLGIKLNEQREFRAALNAILDDPHLTKEERSAKALEHLKKLATVSPQEKEEIRKEIAALPESQSLTPEQLTEKVEEKAKLLLEKKEASLKRLTNEDCIQQIREKQTAEANTVIEAVQKESTKNTALASIGMVLLITGLVVSIAALIFTGPIGIIVTAAIGIAASTAWLALDLYELIKEFKSTDPGRFDKIWILATTILAVVATALVFFLSSGLVPIIIAAVFGAVWLTVNSVCYYRLYHLANKS